MSRKQILPLLLLVLVTLAAYLNAWPDNLTLDDKAFAASERFTGLTLSDTANFFTEDLWSANGGTTGLYRPLLLVTIVMDAYVYGDWVAGYHLSNILLHLLVTILVFGFVRHLLLVSGGQSPLSDRLALLAAMVFGVHPVHAEVVNSIFNRSGLLVSLGVVGGLWWFLRTLEASPLRAWGGLAAIYLVILFCKESSIVLPALAVAMLWIFTPGNWRIHMRRSLPVLWLVIPLGIFLALRANALAAPDLPEVTSVAGLTEAVSAPLPDSSKDDIQPRQIGSTKRSGLHFPHGNLLPASRFLFDSITIVLWPHPLKIFHEKSAKNKWLALVLQFALIITAIVGFRKKRFGLIAGLAFFYLAMLPASRMIGLAGVLPNLAERYVYLPSVGLTITLAFGLKWLTQRYNFRAAMVPGFIALAILTPITLARNADWASDVLLYESDYQQGVFNKHIPLFLVGALLREKNYYRAVKICEQQANPEWNKEAFSHRCGEAYRQTGRYGDAEKAFLFALNDPKTEATVHQKLADMYLQQARSSDALEHFKLAIDTESKPAMREFRKSYMLMKLYPNDQARLLEAKAHLEQALQLQPQFASARQLLDLLNRILAGV